MLPNIRQQVLKNAGKNWNKVEMTRNELKCVK